MFKWIVTLKGSEYEEDVPVVAANDLAARRKALRLHADDPEHVPAWVHSVRREFT